MKDSSDDKALLHNLDANHYDILRRADQQFRLSAQLQQYDADVSELSLRNRAALASINNQERRVRQMQTILMSSSTSLEPTAKLSQPLSEDRRDRVAQVEDVNTISVEGPPTEQKSTSPRRYEIPISTESLLDTSATRRLRQRKNPPFATPNPPTNLVVTSVSPNSFTLEWETSSTDAYDYEIQFNYSSSDGDIQVTQSCSRWCLKKPVPQGKFVVMGLHPNRQYRDIAIRCRNSFGLSGFSDTIESVYTFDAAVANDYQCRKRKFLYRIDHINQSIRRINQSKLDIPVRQVLLARKMSKTQDRILELGAESSRVMMIGTATDNDIVSSPVLHGSRQAFSKEDLQRKLQDELVSCRKSIAQWRADIINLDKESEAMIAELESKTAQLNERKAAWLQFEHRYSIVSNMKKAVSKQPMEIQAYYLLMWRAVTLHRLDMRKVIDSLTCSCRRRICAAAWRKLRALVPTRRENEKQSKATVDGIGGVLLQTAEACVEDTLNDASTLVRNLINMRKDAFGDHNDANDSATANYPSQILCEEDRAIMAKGDLLFNAGYHESSLKFYESVVSKMGTRDYFDGMKALDAFALYSAVNGSVAQCHANLLAWDKAIVYFNRQLSLAEEGNLDSPMAHAMLGLGTCYYAKCDFEYAHGLFERTLELIVSRGDVGIEPTTLYSWLKKTCDLLNRPKDAAKYDEQIYNTRDTRSEQVQSALKSMDSLKQRLVNITASKSRVVNLQVASVYFVQLQREKTKKERRIKDAMEDLATSHQFLNKLRDLENQLTAEIEEATYSKKSRMVSLLVQGSPQEIKTAELIRRLNHRLTILQSKLDECVHSIETKKSRIDNLKDDIAVMEEEIVIEDGPLMRRVLEGRQYRCMSLNAINVARGDVTGTSKGTIEKIVSCEGKECYINNLTTGKLEYVFTGDEEGRHIGEVNGHTATITALFQHGNRLYTGSMDASVIGWNTSKMTKLFIGRGHEATITSIFADDDQLVTGSADTNIIIWNKDNGTIYTCHQRLVLGNGNVTALQYGELEVITGDSLGNISIWWIETGKLLQSCKVHDSRVTALQVDATKAVSCSLDMLIQVIDIIKGERLLTLRGHSAPILAVAFDARGIVSVSSDGELRHWHWNDEDTPNNLIDSSTERIQFDATRSLEEDAEQSDGEYNRQRIQLNAISQQQRRSNHHS
ncbi:predicted protein [Thalassiosira pseudonana CCMP1335]|uniref:Fibronectin type-III domain-containing protein n=1 Tax=Thalassiosira pseudonana TaxID=35128 RepID=B8C8Z1_THAPS|nr:predicted protein [Thalassiosira pseudonana CCMP1335]EED89759.1 predicted protein [Thalassiosira pseudonana CCMP1335]